MNRTSGRYDSDLQMFVDRPREVDPAGLTFLRWLAERGWLEHEPLGPSTGAFARPIATAEEAEARPDNPAHRWAVEAAVPGIGPRNREERS
jgi:hypothetical protein